MAEAPYTPDNEVLEQDFLGHVWPPFTQMQGLAPVVMDRAEGSLDGDPRLDLIRRALSILAGDDTERAEKIQLLFSRSYDADWQSNLLGQRTKR